MVWPATIPTFTAGVVASEADLDAITDALHAIGDAWTAYTPALTGWTLGNGTISGAYAQTGELVRFRLKLILGTTTVVSSNPTITLPVNAIAARAFAFAAGAYRVSTTTHYGLDAMNHAVGGIVVKDGANNLSTTAPFSWAATDELYVSGEYEAA